MKFNSFLMFVFTTINIFCLSNCKSSELNLILNDSSIIDKKVTEAEAIEFGNELIRNQVAISKYQGEVYAHDSKLLIKDGVGYCAYYGNDKSTQEGTKGQSIRLVKFDIQRPYEREVFDVFSENANYTNLTIDKNTPLYTPVLLSTGTNTIRVLAKVFTGLTQKYYYRDFDVSKKSFGDPQLCKISLMNGSNLVDFDIANIRKHLIYLYGANFDLSTRDMYATSEPVNYNGSIYLGLTVGRFDSDSKKEEGVTILMKTNDNGRTFELLNGPDSRNIIPKYNRQFVEAGFMFDDDQRLIMIGRNNLGGMMYSASEDRGQTYITPYSINDTCRYSIKPSKPNLIKYNNGIVSIWNTTENFGNYSFRSVLEIRYGKNEKICDNPIKIKVKNKFGCHYPSLFEYKNSLYLTYTTDTREFDRNSTGEIVFVKLPFF